MRDEGLRRLTALGAVQPTLTLFMENLLAVGQVRDAADREDLREEVQEECSATGGVAAVVVPEPPLWVPNEEPAPVFARFESEAACEAAKATMNGRTFEANTVTAKFISDDLWNKMRGGEWVDHKFVIDNPNASAAAMGQVRPDAPLPAFVLLRNQLGRRVPLQCSCV